MLLAVRSLFDPVPDKNWIQAMSESPEEGDAIFNELQARAESARQERHD